VNRADILRKCVERGVAGETEISSVSRLFYVHLLSALQRGQNVEVPRFGTFSTRVAGVKKIRKIPYFEPAAEMAEKANERFRELKYLLVGTYEQIPAFGEAEFHGKVPPYDTVVETAGKDRIVDTRGEITPPEYERIASDLEHPSQLQEEPVMPRLNLRDESLEEESGAPESGAPMPPTLRDVGGEGGGKMSPVLLVVLVILVLGLGIFALNYFNVIHLWGKKPAAVAESTIPEPSIPEPEVTPPTGGEGEQPAAAVPEVTAPKPEPAAPAKKPQPVRVAPPSGTGDYTVQVSSWAKRSTADNEVGRLSAAGFSAFVEEGMVAGQTWYRVRVGRYASEKEAAQAVKSMQPGMETDLWVARVGR
jgi:cell division septation protein DedD